MPKWIAWIILDAAALDQDIATVLILGTKKTQSCRCWILPYVHDVKGYVRSSARAMRDNSRERSRRIQHAMLPEVRTKAHRVRASGIFAQGPLSIRSHKLEAISQMTETEREEFPQGLKPDFASL
jgi:hypothetical protein